VLEVLIFAELPDGLDGGVDDASDEVLVPRRACDDILAVCLGDKVCLDEELMNG
jgi:hypothetical protein